MKKWLMLALLLPVAGANAKDLYYGPNQDGGMIVLTNENNGCYHGSQYYYATNQNGQIGLMGCWTLQEPWVIGQANGVSSKWAFTAFQKVPESSSAVKAIGPRNSLIFQQE